MRKKQKRLPQYTQGCIVTVTACVCAALCLLMGFSQLPALYPVDYGQYEVILRQCGLDWTQEDILLGGLQYVRPIRFYDYTRFSWESLFTPGAGGGTVYGVALVRLFTAPFGLKFDLDALALVWALILVTATGLLTRALYERFARIWAAPCIVLCVLYSNGNFCAMLRGLYPEAAATAFSLLGLALGIRAWSVGKEKRGKWIFPTLLVSLTAVKSLTPLIVFLPLAIGGNIWLICSCGQCLKKKLLVYFAAALLLLTGVTSALQLAGRDADYYSNASLYEASFNTLLRHTDQPELILAEWGLDESYAADVGKSYYLPEDAYVHNPRDPEEAEILFSRITAGRLMGTCLRHPAIFFEAIGAEELSISRGFENPRNSAMEGNGRNFTATRVDGGFPSLLWKALSISWTAFGAAHLALILTGIVLACRKRRTAYLLISLSSAGCMLYLPFALVMNGYAQSQQYMLYQTLLTVGLLTEVGCGLIGIMPTFTQWMTRYSANASLITPLRRARGNDCADTPLIGPAASRWVNTLCGNRFHVALFTGVCCFGVLLCALVPATHAVSVNNGDFGRMMEQLDITWNSMDYFNTANQANRYAIEQYAYLSDFDAAKLTLLKPTYSLYWFAGIVRLLTEPFGMGFSTYLLAWVMGVIMAGCIIQLVKDLYSLLGKSTVIAAAMLCAMLMNETYLTWYNSLYGEGCILLGLLLTLTCAVHLCVMRRGRSWKKILWLAGLGLSLQILVTAKAQMLMAVPGAILLFLALSFYQRPQRYDLQAVQGIVSLAACAVIVFSAWGVYQTDRTEDSVSQRHTMWQAYFYGIFMISDDPIGDMEALGVDPAMAPDIGKYVDFSDDSKYVYAPLSEEAEEAFYRHVSMGTILSWYLTHPTKLWYMLDHAAHEAQTLYTSFRVYNGQDYSAPDHDEVNGWNLWPGWRTWLTPGTFAGYVLFYGLLLFVMLRRMLKKNTSAQARALCCLPLFLMMTGVLQFPLSVLGNGFADNQKQLFCFALCHDFLLGGTLFMAGRHFYAGGTAKWDDGPSPRPIL